VDTELERTAVALTPESVDSASSSKQSSIDWLANVFPQPIIDAGDFGTLSQDFNFPNIGFSDLLALQASCDVTQLISPSPSPPDSRSLLYGINLDAFAASSAIPAQMPPVHTLIRRPALESGRQRTANLILHTLKSYPLMIMRHKTMPPFIHPGFVASNADSDDLEPLNNCISLLHMYGSGVDGSKKLFWRNVRVECERINQKVL
jgi:hypothetical protein